MRDKVVLCRVGEIALKGLNRSTFERNLAKNMRKHLSNVGNQEIIWSQSRFYVVPENSETYDFDRAVEAVDEIFGIVSSSIATVAATEFPNIMEIAYECVENKIQELKEKGFDGQIKFKVETRHCNKKFPMGSYETSAEAGYLLLEKFPELTVDVHNPDFILYLDIREKAYVYTDIIKAQGGLPIGSNGKAMLLLSGGIDSPVAGYALSKRGVKLCAVHFFSYPYTSERAKEKVLELARILTKYCGPMKVLVVPYTDVQLAIRDNCREELGTVIMRRSMMRIAEHLARMNGCSALVTGESLGQVASQTMQAMYVTDNAANMPVFRPLIANDKVDVIEIARKIGTFETSILPYEDCCTVFTPRHPKTKPTLSEVIHEEERFNYIELETTAIENTEAIYV